MRVAIWIHMLALMSLALPGCSKQREQHHDKAPAIAVITTESKDVTLTQQYVCQIHSLRDIKIRTLEKVRSEASENKDGQAVKAGDGPLTIQPATETAKADARNPKADAAERQSDNSEKSSEVQVSSENERLRATVERAKARAKAELVAAELGFATVKAPFDGIVERMDSCAGTLNRVGEIPPTLSDDSVMWVHFKVPQTRYLEYLAHHNQPLQDLKIELVQADGSKFDQPGKIVDIETDFNNETGDIPCRAVFLNPNGVLNHGQTGTVWISRVQKNAIVIPRGATFDVLRKEYVYVIDKDDVAHQREIIIEDELEDLYVIKTGLKINDKIVLDGLQRVNDGQKVQYDSRRTKQVDADLK